MYLQTCINENKHSAVAILNVIKIKDRLTIRKILEIDMKDDLQVL